MFVFWNQAKNVKRKDNPIRLMRQCGQCNKSAMFYECEKTDEFKLYGVIALKSDRTTVMQCGECLAVYKAEDDPDVQKHMERRKQTEDAAQAKESERAEAERRREEEKRQDEFRRKEAKKQKEIDDELADLKRELGQ